MADGSRQSIDEENQEDDEDDQNETDDDVLFVIPPDEVVEALEGAHKPGEGGVWAAVREAREKSGKGAMMPTHGILQTSGSTSDSHFLEVHKEMPGNGIRSCCLEAGAIQHSE